MDQIYYQFAVFVNGLVFISGVLQLKTVNPYLSKIPLYILKIKYLLSVSHLGWTDNLLVAEHFCNIVV